MPAPALKAVRFALFAFVGASVAAGVYKIAAAPAGAGAEAGPESSAAAGTGRAAARFAPEVKTGEGRTAVVYYFYTDTRCSSCETIEAYTKAAVGKNFPSEYKGWKTVFRGVNIDEEANGHFVKDYGLSSKSVVVQKFAGGKALEWVKLEKVWQLLGDKAVFMNYVADETRQLLDEK